MTEYHLETKLQHPRFTQHPLSAPLIQPIYQCAKFKFSSYQQLADHLQNPSPNGFLYSRGENPTIMNLERTLADLAGTDEAIATTSGLGAIFVVLLSTLNPGDRVVYFMEGYRPTRLLLDFYAKRWQIIPVLLSILDEAELADELANSSTRAIIFESPTNPQLCSLDLAKVCAQARQNNVLTIWDHTSLGPKVAKIADVDLYVQSLTKFASGHGDLIAGAICGRREIMQRVKEHAYFVGHTLDPNTAFLVSRGLRTLEVRQEHSKNTSIKIQSWMEQSGRFMDVRRSGSLIYAVLQGDETLLVEFIDSLQLFSCAPSFGSCESLIAPIRLFYARGMSDEQQCKAALLPGSLRFSIGLENVDDLINDLNQALGKVFADKNLPKFER